MQQKYKERQMLQQKKKPQHKETPFGSRRSTHGGRDSVTSEKHRRRQDKLGHSNSLKNQNTTYNRLLKRAAADSNSSLEFQRQYNRSFNNENNPHSKDGYYYGKGDKLSPRSRMILQSEAQFLDSYGRRSERRMGHSNTSEGNSMWDKLSRIFSFGCIETSHNNNTL